MSEIESLIIYSKKSIKQNNNTPSYIIFSILILNCDRKMVKYYKNRYSITIRIIFYVDTFFNSIFTT